MQNGRLNVVTNGRLRKHSMKTSRVFQKITLLKEKYSKNTADCVEQETASVRRNGSHAQEGRGLNPDEKLSNPVYWRSFMTPITNHFFVQNLIFLRFKLTFHIIRKFTRKMMGMKTFAEKEKALVAAKELVKKLNEKWNLIKDLIDAVKTLLNEKQDLGMDHLDDRKTFSSIMDYAARVCDSDSERLGQRDTVEFRLIMLKYLLGTSILYHSVC